MRKKLFLLKMRISIWKVHWQEHGRVLKTLQKDYQRKVTTEDKIMLASDIQKELEKGNILLPLSDIQKIYRRLKTSSNRRLTSIEDAIRCVDLSEYGKKQINKKEMYPDFQKLFKTNYFHDMEE